MAPQSGQRFDDHNVAARPGVFDKAGQKCAAVRGGRQLIHREREQDAAASAIRARAGALRPVGACPPEALMRGVACSAPIELHVGHIVHTKGGSKSQIGKGSTRFLDGPVGGE